MVQNGISAEQRNDFAEQGFLYVPGMFSPAEIAEIAGWAQEILDRPEEAGKEWKYFEQSANGGARILNRVERLVEHHAGFDRLCKDARILGGCSVLFGDDAVLFKEKINFKLPGGGGFEPHQDMQAGWDVYGGLHISVMVAIDATTPENGALEIIGGLHRGGLLGEMWQPLEAHQTDGHDWQPLYCQPGDVLFFDSFAPHRSGPNRTSQARRALYLTYGRAADGDQRDRYYADKHKNYPPDIDRDPRGDYGYKV